MHKNLCISNYCRIFASEKETNNKLNPKTRKGIEIMTKTSTNGMTAIGYMVENPNFIKKGEYKRTELDDYKDSVDFLITSIGKRYEIIFNRPTIIKTSRSIESIGDGIYTNRSYLVTDKALDSLKAKFTCATDF